MNTLKPFLASLRQRFTYGDQLRPQRDWALLIALGSILFAASVAFNVWFFIASETGKITGPAVTPTPKQLNADAVTNVQTIFKQRATEEGNYQNQYYFVDPTQPGS